MKAIIFIGVQASGKTTFYRDFFFKTHMHINLDMLKTRHRENIFLQACLTAKQPFVVDNTNPTVAERERYIIPAKQAKFKTIAYYFTTTLDECKARNEKRSDREKIPLVGILGTYKKIVKSTHAEGFDEIYRVSNGTENKFIVEKIANEI